MKSWNYLCASVQGKSHIEKGISCQDYSFSFQHKDYAICVVSDGASTCEYSSIGSENVTHFAITHFTELVERKKWTNPKTNIIDKEWKKEAQITLRKIHNDLEEKICPQGYSLISLSCTIIVVIHLKNKLLVTHIGDGRAGYCTTNNEWCSMIEPCKGAYANETVFITSKIWSNETTLNKYIESSVIRENIKAFCLLTDGCENASFECYKFNEELQMPEDINKPYKDFFDANVNVNIPNLIKEGKEEKELNEIWKSFLKDGNDALKNETDDKTMILAVKKIEKSVI